MLRCQFPNYKFIFAFSSFRIELKPDLQSDSSIDLAVLSEDMKQIVDSIDAYEDQIQRYLSSINYVAHIAQGGQRGKNRKRVQSWQELPLEILKDFSCGQFEWSRAPEAFVVDINDLLGANPRRSRTVDIIRTRLEADLQHFPTKNCMLQYALIVILLFLH